MSLASLLPSSQQPQIEGRRARRQRVLLPGKIVFEQARRTVDCMIRDLSPEGARLRLLGPEMLPDCFYVIDFRQGAAFEAVVEWRRPSELGVKFGRGHRLQDAQSLEMRTMRQIWMEHVARP